jgi:hypothetical protein
MRGSKKPFSVLFTSSIAEGWALLPSVETATWAERLKDKSTRNAENSIEVFFIENKFNSF